MYQFSGSAKLFNGRFWREIPLRVKATSLPVAIAKGIRQALLAKRKGERIEAASVTLERLGRVDSDEIVIEEIQTNDQAMLS